MGFEGEGEGRRYMYIRTSCWFFSFFHNLGARGQSINFVNYDVSFNSHFKFEHVNDLFIPIHVLRVFRIIMMNGLIGYEFHEQWNIGKFAL